MKYFLRSLLIGLLCLAPLSTDATQRVAALISPQAINVDLGFVQVGNVGNLSVMGAPSGATFSLLTNPGGHFSIAGTEIVAEPSTPAGQYSISVQATGTGYSVSKTFVLNFSGGAPPGAFAIGGTLSGMENNFPALPVAAEFTYLHNKSLTSVRLPIEWSDVNGQEGAPIGFQPTPFGALETTSTYLNAPLTGPNFLYQSQAPVPTVVATQAPYVWQTFTSGTGTASGTAATAPDGTNTAAQISLNRSDTSSYAVYYQYLTSPTLGPLTGGIWLKGCSGADVGKVVSFNFNPASAGSDNVGLINITLTGTWTQYSTTASIPANLVAFQIGYNGAFGSGSTGAACMSVWAPQVNAGSSLGTYVPTSGGYVQAVDNLIATAAANNLDVILDYHDFGFGPGLAGVFPISSLTASGTTVTATASGSASLINGSNVVISTANPNDGYNGQYNVFNVTPTTFQYTLASPPSISPASGTSSWAGEHAELGTTRLPISAFGDLWSKTAAHYKTTTNIRYDLMNEPVNGFDSTVWFNAAQAAITAIRATGDTHVIYVEGVNFAGAWNWVSGEGQPFNSANLYLLNDPLNNLIFSAHGYPDRDCSGNHFAYPIESTVPGECPSPISTNPTIQVTRFTPFVQWCAQHQVRCHVGEGAVASNDPISANGVSVGGVSNYQAWNLILQNHLTFLQANNIETTIWGGGPGFGPSTPYAGYGFNYEPSNVIDPTQKDFTSAGLQSTQMVIIDKFSGFSGAQPLAYSFTLPVDGSFNPIRYGSVGVASGNFTLSYNAKITSPIIVTPHATLMDGTSGGGTFTPATVTFQPGDNATATVTYTPSQVATFQIGATNNGALIDPPLLGYASSTDIFAGTNAKNLYGMFRQVGPYIGPAYKIQRLTDGTQQDFKFNNAGNLPRQSIQNFLSGRTGKIVVEYDQSGSGNNKVPCQVANSTCGASMANPPTFTLVNSAGYPEKTIASGQTMVANSPSNNQGQQSILARANASNAGLLISQDIFSGQFRMTGTSLYLVAANGAPITTVSLGSNTGVFASVVGTTSNLYSTNNVNGYQNGTLAQSASATPFTFQPFNGAQETDFYTFRFSPLPFVGSVYYEDITYTEFSAGTVAGRATADAAYYSTSLPDALTAAPPTVIGVAPNTAFTVVPNTPFASITIRDDNSGSPTDSIVLTLSGAAGTLSGTGITGSNPYTIAAASAASVTSTLQALTLNTSATTGSVINVTIAVTSSAGPSSSPVMPITVQAYQAETPFTPPGGTFTPVSATPQASKGYNFSGMENGTRSNALVFGPSHYMIDYLAGKGFSNFRLPHTSRWTYPTAFGLLDTSFMAATKSIVDYAFTKNIYVIIDPHDGGRIWDSAANNFALVSSADPRSSALFADYWRRLSTLFKNYPNVIFGLNNEPASQTAVQWRDGGVIPAIAAIRTVGANQLITIPGTSFTGAWTWQLSGSAGAFAGFNSDPANNFVFEMHQYLDTGGALGTGSGSSPIAGLNGSTQLDTSPNGLATTWLIANGFQAVNYEFGVAPDPYQSTPNTSLAFDSGASSNATGSITQNGNMLTYMAAHSAQWPGWSAWGGGYNFATLPNSGSGYGYNPEPLRNAGINTGYVIPTIDQQQMGLLTSFLP